MQVIAKALWLQKAGNRLEEYEDAFCPEESDTHADTFYAAVADGATETSFAAEWAKLLVRSYCDGRFAVSDLENALPKIQRWWSRSVNTLPLAWYAEEKLKMGAYSSLLGLTLRGESDSCRNKLSWEAISIGDSCLFHIRRDRIIKVWPLWLATQFNSRPILLSSNPENNFGIACHIQQTGGEWELGDEFYLMTDALACWFLQAVGQGMRLSGVLQEFVEITQPTKFEKLIGQWRSSKLMRNDDITWLRILAK